MSSLIDAILGRTSPIRESDSIIPTEAHQIRVDTVGAGASPVPSTDAAVEPLIATSFALVAPDATPGTQAPLSPTSVPAPKSPAPQAVPSPVTTAPAGSPGSDPGMQAMRAFLPRRASEKGSEDPTVREITTESVQRLLGTPGQDAYQDSAVVEAVATAATQAAQVMEAGVPMPDHVPGDIAQTMNTFRRFGHRATT